jgi:glycosyltransferase involved in cell wall biosynthesis
MNTTTNFPFATNPTHPQHPTVSVIVPALNEEQSIGWVMDNIPTWVSEVVLVDGLSVDGTELVCTDRRDDIVIVHQPRKGKGAALRAGFAAASGDIIVMIDADGSTDPREIGRFVDALTNGADFVKGSRNMTAGGSIDFTLMRHLGNLGFVYAANLLFRQSFTDLCYGYCAFWNTDLNKLKLTADGFEIEMELILSAIKANLNIVEVPSIELQRRFGESNLNAWTDGKRVLKTMLKERFTRLANRITAPSAITITPTLMPAHTSTHWLPAGSDTRTPAQHANADTHMTVLIAHTTHTTTTNPIPAITTPTITAPVATLAPVASAA